jgi:hypothetical protein
VDPSGNRDGAAPGAAPQPGGEGAAPDTRTGPLACYVEVNHVELIPLSWPGPGPRYLVVARFWADLTAGRGVYKGVYLGRRATSLALPVSRNRAGLPASRSTSPSFLSLSK